MTLLRRWIGADPDPDRSLATIAATLRAVSLIAGAGIVLWLLGSYVLVVFTAVLFGLLLRGLSEAMSRLTRLPVKLSLAVVTLGAAAVIALFAFFDGPHFVREMQQLASTLIPEIQRLTARWGGTAWGRYLLHAMPDPAGGPGAFSTLDTGFGLLGTALIVVLAAIYIAADPLPYVRGVVQLFPIASRERVATVMYDCGRALQWWMLGQGIDMLAVGVISISGLALLGVPLPFALGTLAGLLTFIPYFGAWLGSVPAVLMALTVGFDTALWTVGLFLLCHLVEGYLLSPIVSRRTVDLAPAATLLSMSLLGSLYGATGLVLATPIAAAVLVGVREGYVATVLRDPVAEARMGE